MNRKGKTINILKTSGLAFILFGNTASADFQTRDLFESMAKQSAHSSIEVSADVSGPECSQDSDEINALKEKIAAVRIGMLQAKVSRLSWEGQRTDFFKRLRASDGIDAAYEKMIFFSEAVSELEASIRNKTFELSVRRESGDADEVKLLVAELRSLERKLADSIIARDKAKREFDALMVDQKSLEHATKLKNELRGIDDAIKRHEAEYDKALKELGALEEALEKLQGLKKCDAGDKDKFEEDVVEEGIVAGILPVS